ncbi:MAG: hypothetical protein DI533_00275 [Cereibacter sphaeroides]|uniref:Recombinase RecT n=1 Tax=Cereibacter sphaeroides TaxID=1063 RepID=A0A2W5SB16_CERSP|nr:MAG: hypothetical protein DI533_00275 [Cereibacter sphaeroides]
MNDQPRTDVVSRDQRRLELEQLTFSQNGQLFQPKSGRELMDMANMMSTAGFMVKDIYRANPGACMALIAICAPYGLNPLQVSWKTYKASKSDDAPIAFEAQAIVAMVNASGAVLGGLRYSYEGEGDSRVCICSGQLAMEALPLEVRSPPLSKITPKNSPLWKADPDQQLAYYTGRNWARRYKPEMLLGVYDVDELSAPPIRDVTPREPGGFSQMAQAARKAPEPDPAPIEGEIMPTDAEIEAANEAARLAAEESNSRDMEEVPE